MNSHLRQMIIERSEGKYDHARYRMPRYHRYDREMERKHHYDYDMDYGMDYADEYETDGRQGVKGTGRYGIGGSRYYPRRDYGHTEHEGKVMISPKHMRMWEKELKNADGSHGTHFEESQIMPIAQKLGIKFDMYSEEEFVLVANMLYSDFCEALKSIVTPEREHIVYSKLAKAWLEDKDTALKGSEKLAVYYYCIVNDEE